MSARNDDRDMSGFTSHPFPSQPVPDGWEELHRRSIAAKEAYDIANSGCLELEALWSLPAIEPWDRNAG